MANAHSLTHSLTRSQILKYHITYPHKQLSCPLFSACAARCKYRPGVRQRATLGGGGQNVNFQVLRNLVQYWMPVLTVAACTTVVD